MAMYGPEQFDPGSIEAWRYMFRPSAMDPSLYFSAVNDGEPVCADDLLGDYLLDYADAPVPRKAGAEKQDPREIPGAIAYVKRV